MTKGGSSQTSAVSSCQLRGPNVPHSIMGYIGAMEKKKGNYHSPYCLNDTLRTFVDFGSGTPREGTPHDSKKLGSRDLWNSSFCTGYRECFLG